MLATVCDRNSTGVELLRRGLHVQSQFVLREAVEGLLSTVVGVSDRNLSNPCSLAERTVTIDIDNALRNGSIANDNNNNNIDVDDDVSKSDTTFAMYKKAFLVGSDERNEVVLSLVLFYNLGAASHAMGIATGKSGCFTRALKLYGKVYALLSEHGHGLSDVTLLLLATCNNTGHIYSLLLNKEGMQACHSQLQTIISMNQGMGLDRSDLDFFFMAIVLGCNEQSRLPMAPAA